MHDHILQPSFGTRNQQTTFNSFNDLEDLFPRKTSVVVQPMPTHVSALSTPEKENQLLKPFSASPILGGYGSLSHNVTRMLGEKEEVTQQQKSHLSDNVNRSSRFTPYSTSRFLSYRPKLKTQNTNDVYRHEDDPIVDIGNESHEHLRTSDAPNITDSSISTQGSSSPQSSASPPGSARSSPGSGPEPVTSPEGGDEQAKEKNKARTNYTNEQVQTLLKIFHENPYPDSEMMETIAKDLGVPENKIKIWFQNKRARWRRRVNDNINTYPQSFFPVSPMLSPVNPYGFMPTGHMMTSSPPQPMGGYFNYPWMQPGSVSPNNNQQQYPVNPGMQSRLQPANQTTAPHISSQQYPPVTMTTPSVSTLSAVSPYSMRTSPQQMVTSQQGRQFQYPQIRYQSSYGVNSGYMGQ